jgi:hypothetical protein
LAALPAALARRLIADSAAIATKTKCVSAYLRMCMFGINAYVAELKALGCWLCAFRLKLLLGENPGV